MKQLSLILLLSSLLAVWPGGVSAQLNVSTAYTPANLVQNFFAAPGITISNVSFSGSPLTIGHFTANGTNLGMTEGIVMTTGTVVGQPNGPQGPNNSESSGVDNGLPGYGPLTSLAGNSTYDAAVLEFDFKTCSDHVQFNYVFGSEEFLEYCETQFNDVFAFYISGPGISGLQNIATLPNGQAVAINNIHSAGTNVNFQSFGPENAQYYVNNANGATIQYDGFTTLLTAEADVQCDQTYHLVLAIADVGDGVWDSGVFLEAHSFTPNAPVDASYTLSSNIFGDGSTIAEDCASATITLERVACNLNSPMVVPVTVSGTATEGVDFNNIPPSITFPAGSNTVDFEIDAFSDGITEGPETIILNFLFTDNCGNQTTLTLNLTINELTDMQVNIQGGAITCPGEAIELVANVTGGGTPYTYLWSTGETTPSIFVAPNASATYSVTVVDDCIGIPVTATYSVVVPNPPPLDLNETPDITNICPYVPAQLDANATGGFPPYTYQWSSNFNANLGNGPGITAIPSTTTTYTVIVTDNCGNSVTENIVYTITSPPLVLEMSPNVEICPGDSVQISVSSSGGYGQHYYYWFHSGETTPQVWVHPSQTTTYTVSVSDECQTFTVEGSTQVVVVAPTADFTAYSTTFFNDMPITFTNQSQNAVTYQWFFGDGNSDTFSNPTNTYDEPGLYYVTLIATDEKGCTDTIVKPINIEEEWWIYVPNTFTPDGDRSNNDFRASTIGIRQLDILIFNRWGELIFEAHDQNFIWDGTYNGRYANDGTYTYKIHFITNSGREKDIVGHVNLLK